MKTGTMATHSGLLMALSVACSFAALSAHAYDEFDWSAASGTVTVPAGKSYLVTESDIGYVNGLTGITVSGGSGETAMGELVFTGSTVPTVAISGAGRVVKRSTHNWTLSTAISSFTGFYVLEGGVTSTALRYQLGSTDSSAGGVVISNGATVVMSAVNGADAEKNQFNWRPLYLSGDGAPGQNGALVTSGNAGAWNFTRKVVLLSDAKIHLVRESYFLGGVGGLDLGPYTLTVSGTGPMDIRENTVVTGTGNIAISPNSYLLVYPDGRLTNDGTGVIELKNGARYAFYNDVNPQDRPILVTGTNAILNHVEQYAYGVNSQGWHGWSDAYNEQRAPITFAAEGTSLRLDARDNRCQLMVSGRISGPGSIKIGEYSYGAGRFVFACPTNDYTGSTWVGGGKGAFLVAAASNSIPNYASVTCTHSRISAKLSDDGSTWCEDALRRLAFEATWGSWGTPAIYTGDLTDKAYQVDGAAWEAAAPAGKLWSLGHDGEGVMTLDGPIARGDTFATYDGTLMMTGSQYSVANLLAVADTGHEGGTLVIADADVILTNEFRVGGFTTNLVAPAGIAHAMISNATVRIGSLSSANEFIGASQGIHVGRVGDGTLDICAGSVVTARVENGNANQAHAAVFQKDSHVTAWGTGHNANDGAALNHIGRFGYGYWNVDGDSTLDFLGYTAIASWGGGTARQYDAQGILDITGGTVTHKAHASENQGIIGGKSYFATANLGASWGAIRVAGDGKLQTSKNITFYIGLGGNHSESHLVLDGDDAAVELGNGLTFNGGDNTRSFLDLYAGSLQGNIFRKEHSSGTATYLNFNGGAFRPSGWGNELFGTPEGNNTPDRVTIYERGAIFDMYNKVNYVSVPMQKPSGKGILEAPVPEALSDVTFVGPPMIHVKAVDGGDGATLWPVWDRATGKLTSIRVISPGFDYDNGATVVVRYGTQSWSTAAVVGEVPGGPLIVKGIECLELKATNTWSGGTIICDTASIKSVCDWAIPSNTVLTLNGGKLNLNNKQAIFAGVRGTGGTVQNGTVKIADVWKYDAADYIAGMKTALTGSIEFLPGAKIEVENPELLLSDEARNCRSVKFITATSITGTPEFVVPASVPAAWFKKDGNSLAFGVTKGLSVIVR